MAGVALNVTVADLPYAVDGAVVTITFLTAAGGETLTCGDLATLQACLVRDGGKLANLPGSYCWFPSSGVLAVANEGDLQPIAFQAVRVPAAATGA